MPLSRSERVNLLDRVLAVFEGRSDGQAWPESRLNLVLSGFDLQEAHGTYQDELTDTVLRSLRNASDETLSEIADHLRESTQDGRDQSDNNPLRNLDLWRAGMLRIFLSHAAERNNFAEEVTASLRLYGIHGFVAHNAIKPSREWQDEIERALRSSDAFVALIHPEFLASPWTNQEVGWAYGVGLPVYAIRLGVDPRGFLAKIQWPSMVEDGEAVAREISLWVDSRDEFSGSIGDRLIAVLREVENYVDAGNAANAIRDFGQLSQTQFDDLDDIYRTNDQVGDCLLARRALKPLYKRHRREFPPPSQPDNH